MSVSLVHSYAFPGGPSELGVLAKRAYRIAPGGRAAPLPDPPPIHREPVFVESPSAPGARRLAHDSDLLAFVKPLTDVLVSGQAHSRRGAVSSIDTAVEVGRARKAVRVFGDRRIEAGGQKTFRFSPPQPFTSMPIAWDLAYGGRDAYAERKLFSKPQGGFSRRRHPLHDAGHGLLTYPRNAAGRGFFIDIDPARVAGCLAPNLDDPADPVLPDRLFARDALDWIDRPSAASYGPIDWFTFPRVLFFMLRPDWAPPTRPVHELSLGAASRDDLNDRDLSAPPDRRLYNCAPAGLAVCRLEGGERVKLWNLHRAHELFEFDLPMDRPRCLLEPQGAGARELDARLQTVLIEPDDDRVTLTWTAAIAVARPYPAAMMEQMRHSVRWAR